MSNWVPNPELDENAKVGLSFIAIGYGVVLVAVFPVTPLSRIGAAGWLHLGLAAFMLIISYLGYYTNRVKYAAWKVSFFNFSIVAVYSFFRYSLSILGTGHHSAEARLAFNSDVRGHHSADCIHGLSDVGLP